MVSKYKKLILTLLLILLISSLGIFVLGTEKAQASTIMEDVTKGFLMLIGYMLLGVLWLAGQLLSVAASLVSGLLAWTSFTKAPMVIIGWKIVRDLTNMLFVLGLLIIAFATILRLETYGMKALLPKLVIAALLINFSLVLVGPIIDFSQVLTQFFVDGSGGTNFTANIANSLNLSKVTPYKKDVCNGWGNCNAEYSGCLDLCSIGDLPTDSVCLENCQQAYCECTGGWSASAADTGYNWGEGIMDTINVVMGLLMSIVFTVVAVFAFSAFAFFLLVRILSIWFLLILAPIVWLFWVLPNTRHHFTQWWNSFIKWCFFAPAYMFFVYLALKTYPAFLSQSILDAADTGTTPDTLLPKLLSAEYLLQFILVLGILLGGLVVAQKMGVHGAEGAIRLAKGAGKGTAKWAGKRAQIAATRPIKGAPGAMGDRLLRGLEKVPILRQATRPTRAFIEKERAAMATSEKKYRGWTSDNLKTDYRAANARDKTAISKVLADRGDFKANDKLGFTEQYIEEATKLSKRYEQEGSILKARPDLAPLVDKNIEKVVADIKPKDIEKFQIEAIGKVGEKQTERQKTVEEAIKKQFTEKEGKWNKSIIVKMAETNPTLNIKVRKDIIEPNLNNVHEDVKKYIQSETGKAITGEQEIIASVSETDSQEAKKTSYEGK